MSSEDVLKDILRDKERWKAAKEVKLFIESKGYSNSVSVAVIAVGILDCYNRIFSKRNMDLPTSSKIMCGWFNQAIVKLLRTEAEIYDQRGGANLNDALDMLSSENPNAGEKEKGKKGRFSYTPPPSPPPPPPLSREEWKAAKDVISFMIDRGYWYFCFITVSGAIPLDMIEETSGGNLVVVAEALKPLYRHVYSILADFIEKMLELSKHGKHPNISNALDVLAGDKRIEELEAAEKK